MAASDLADADLHALVDGHVEPDRRADLLRRLAGSPGDRALVEAWQGQADLIRDAFRDVVREPVPSALDLAPPRLRSVEPDRSPKAQAPARRSGGGAAITAALLITIGLTLSWMAGSRDDGAATGAARAATGDSDKAAGLAPFRIPDLSASGLRLVDVSSNAAESAAVVLRFRDGGAGRLALKITPNGPDVGPLPLERAGRSLTWRSQDAVYTLAGNVPADKLRSVADALRGAQGTP